MFLEAWPRLSVEMREASQGAPGVPGLLTRSLAVTSSPATLPSVSNKELVLDLLRRLPEEVSLQQIASELKFMAGVREGLDQLDQGLGVPLEGVEKMIASWVARPS